MKRRALYRPAQFRNGREYGIENVSMRVTALVLKDGSNSSKVGRRQRGRGGIGRILNFVPDDSNFSDTFRVEREPSLAVVICAVIFFYYLL